MHRDGVFQVLAMDCLAAVVINRRSLNWRWVSVKGLLFRGAIVWSSGIGVSNRVESILNTSVQNACTVGNSHQMCTCVAGVVQPRK